MRFQATKADVLDEDGEDVPPAARASLPSTNGNGAAPKNGLFRKVAGSRAVRVVSRRVQGAPRSPRGREGTPAPAREACAPAPAARLESLGVCHAPVVPTPAS